MSLVVMSLIIVVLVLIAIGIVWVVVMNIVGSGVEQVDYNSKCLNVNIRVTAVVNIDNTNYNITFKRSASGGDIAGMKLVFFNPSGEASNVVGSEGNIESLATVTRSINGEIENASKIEFTPYFEDASENQIVCSTTGTYEF